jgi:hypothetical protein
MAAFPGGTSCSATASAPIVFIVLGATEHRTFASDSTSIEWTRVIQRIERGVLLVSDRHRDLSAELRDRIACLKADIDLFLPKMEKALQARREYADFVDLVGGPAPGPRSRVKHSRQRTQGKQDVWRPRALRRYRHSTASG